jgi:hypothetical protein
MYTLTKPVYLPYIVAPSLCLRKEDATQPSMGLVSNILVARCSFGVRACMHGVCLNSIFWVVVLWLLFTLYRAVFSSYLWCIYSVSHACRPTFSRKLAARLTTKRAKAKRRAQYLARVDADHEVRIAAEPETQDLIARLNKMDPKSRAALLRTTNVYAA